MFSATRLTTLHCMVKKKKQMQLKNRIRDEFLGSIDKNVKENQIIQKNVFIAFRMT